MWEGFLNEVECHNSFKLGNELSTMQSREWPDLEEVGISQGDGSAGPASFGSGHHAEAQSSAEGTVIPQKKAWRSSSLDPQW